MGWLSFFIPWLVYLFALAPTFTVGDSGELVAGVASLGLPHAPDYPLFCLMGRWFGGIFALGNWGYRTNLFSSVCMAGTVHLLWRWARRAGFSSMAAFFGSLVLGVFPLFVHQAVVTEVFSLHAFWGALLAVVLWETRSWPLFGFLFGLGMGNHHTLMLLLPAFFLRWIREEGLWRRKKEWMVAAFLFFLGFSIYLYLPLRSAKNPVLNWGQPTSWQRFTHVLSRKDYGSFSLTVEGSSPQRLASCYSQTARFFRNIRKNTGIPLLLFSALGWALWWKKDRRLCAFAFLWSAVSGPGFLCLGNPPFNSELEGTLVRFYLLPLLPWVGAWAALWEFLTLRVRRWVWALCLLPLWIGAGLYRSGELTAWREDWLNYDYGRNILRSLPPRAAFFMDGGDDTFYSVAALQLAQRLRTDVEPHDRGGLVFPNPYGRDFRSLSKQEKESRRQEVEKQILSFRPLYYSTMNPQILQGTALRWLGLAQPVRASDLQRLDSSGLWPFYVQRAFYDQVPADYRTRALACYFPFMKGLFWEQRQDAERAGWCFRWAECLGGDVLWLGTNLVLEYNRLGYEAYLRQQWGRARLFYRESVRLGPAAADAWMNLGAVLERLNEDRNSEAAYLKSIEINPNSPQAYHNLGALYWKLKDWKRAEEAFAAVLKMEPQNRSAEHFLNQARLRQK